MKKYFAYVDGNPHLFKYAPEDGRGAVDFPINSLINQTSNEYDEDIMVVAIMWKGTPEDKIIDFKQELFSIHDPDHTDLKILRIKELFPKYLMSLTDYMIMHDYVQDGDIMYWDATQTVIAQCIHTLFVWACESYEDIGCEKVIMTIGDIIFDITAQINVEEMIRILRKENVSDERVRNIVHQTLTL